jgi:AcrR family transcriptional regulator
MPVPSQSNRYEIVAFAWTARKARPVRSVMIGYDPVAMGNPRSERARAEVLEATADLVADVGVDRVTIDEVAARSGVAKTTIYRHWPTKQALVVDAVRSVCFPEAATPNTGDLRADLVACFEGMVRAGLSGRTGQMLPSLLDCAHRDPALDVLLRDYLRERSGPTRTVLELAQLRGELPADLDLDFAVTLVVGPLIYRKVILRQPVTAPFVEAVVDATLRALGADPAPVRMFDAIEPAAASSP